MVRHISAPKAVEFEAEILGEIKSGLGDFATAPILGAGTVYHDISMGDDDGCDNGYEEEYFGKECEKVDCDTEWADEKGEDTYEKEFEREYEKVGENLVCDTAVADENGEENCENEKGEKSERSESSEKSEKNERSEMDGEKKEDCEKKCGSEVEYERGRVLIEMMAAIIKESQSLHTLIDNITETHVKIKEDPIGEGHEDKGITHEQRSNKDPGILKTKNEQINNLDEWKQVKKAKKKKNKKDVRT